MASFFSAFTDEHLQFIQKQHMFFVATAPSNNGRVNLSPKGYDTLRILNNKQIMYADYHGSGNETANHIRENERITFMWNSFDEEPLILRVYGLGKVIGKDNEQFDQLWKRHYEHIEVRVLRQFFIVNIEEVQTSCGWGVPLMTFTQDRMKLDIESKEYFKQ